MVKSALPGPGVTLVGQDGNMNPPWYQYFQAEHNRTGGNSTDLILENTTDIGDATAQGLFRAVQGTTEAGAQATIELRVRAGLAEAFRTAVLRLNAKAGTDSEIDIDATFVKISGTLLLNGALTTSMGAANAWSLPGSVTGAGSITATVGAVWTFVTSFTDTFIGRPISIRPGVEFDNTDAADHNLQVAITVDSTDPTVGTPPYSTVGNLIVPKSPAAFIWAFPIADTPSAGAHTYRIYFKQQDGGANVRARKWSMEYQEVRR